MSQVKQGDGAGGVNPRVVDLINSQRRYDAIHALPNAVTSRFDAGNPASGGNS